MRNIKDVRLRGFDYNSDGYYFVTAVCNFRRNYFEHREEDVKKEIFDVVDKTSGASLDFYVVMPNHIHIIFVLKKSQLKLGEIVRRIKAKVSKSFGQNVWQPNYYEHIIRNDEALNKIREYILRNPAEELIEFKQFYE